MAAVTQATSCCSVVTVMRTGSVDIDRLNGRGTHIGGQRKRERDRSKARFMQRVKKTARQKGRERGGSGEIEADRSQLIGGLYSSDSLAGKVLS